ncbi:exodeoxyribonuclease I [Roseateles depolymerans]|uniref:Exodeoxyribonuclease I n=1 Tax=Roseateles depolymerans TaxID=76731 RepID=A0A0U3MFU0_9BURK|nr:exodeoxyribonuclease I [Roseateles depolymerans]ALV07241.1 Exodeoxyribonuclease I [Roseateles depolymerans]REG20224.1 exodeoxyribonuclease I subunit C [Roseateles depolymerans]
MHDLTFYWHDYETFGRVPRRDRPAQFAGIRTDAELNEIGEPLMVYCQPSADSLPDPESCLLTGILPQTCAEHGRPEHEFAAAIHAELSRPGTVGLGYNTIRFDDEVTRFLFWRNLMDPYAREWQNDCGRWDLLDVVRCAYALRPEGIEWPRHEDGRPSFKLEHLTKANGLAHEAAHDALSDVRATIALARLIRARQPRLWDFCLKLRRKDAVWQEIGTQRPFLHVSGMYGVEKGCIALVWPLASHPTNKNELIVWDLSHDPRELLDLDADTIRQRLYTRQDELPEGVTRLPIKTVHVNKSPIVISSLKILSPEMAQRWGLDVPQGLAHAELLAQRGGEMMGRWAEVFQRPAAGGEVDVDEDLYGGFLGNEDRRALERLRGLSPEALAERVAQGKVAFEDARLEELLFRYRARNWPELLSGDEQARWEKHCADRLHLGAGGAQTLAEFFDRIDTLAEAAEASEDERAQEILAALYDWAEQIAPPAP